MLDGTHETFELETLGHPEQPLELLLPELHLSAVHEVQQHPGLLEGNVLGEERTVNGGMLGGVSVAWSRTVRCSLVFSIKRLWKYEEQAARTILWHFREVPSTTRLTSQKVSTFYIVRST